MTTAEVVDNVPLMVNFVKRIGCVDACADMTLTPYPLGFNDNSCDEGIISKIPDFDVFS